MKTRTRLTTLCLALSAAAGCAGLDDEQPGIPFDEIPAPPAAAGKADGADDVLSACPGVDSGLPVVTGLPGSYLRLAPFGDQELLSLQLASFSLEPEAPNMGAYSALVKHDGIVSREDGVYAAIGDNPAIGAAIAFDADATVGDPVDSMRFDDVYFILGSRTSALGRNTTLCLVHYLDPEQGTGKPFQLSRVGL